MKNLLISIFLFLFAMPVMAQSSTNIPPELYQQYPEGIISVSRWHKSVYVLAAKKNGKWGMVAYNGKCILPFEYDEIYECCTCYSKKSRLFYEITAKKNGKWGVVDLNNHVLMPFKRKKSYIKYNQKCALADKAVKEYGESSYQAKIKYMKDTYNSYIERQKAQAKAEAERRKVTPVCSDGKWGFISEAKPTPTYEYDSCEKLSENVFLVSKNGKFGTIDVDGAKILLPFEYDILKLSDYSLLNKKDKFGIMDNKTGKVVLTCVYDNIFSAENVSPRLFYLVKNEKWGLGNLQGELCTCKYDFIDQFTSKEATYYYKGYTGKIGIDGKETVSAVKEAFERVYNMDDSEAAEKLQCYEDVLVLNKELNSSYAGACLNNMGVLCENAGDRDSALSYYSRGAAAGDKTAVSNYKRLRGQIRAEKWSAIADALGQMSESLAATANQYSGGSTGSYGGSYNGGSNYQSGSLNNTRSSANHPGMSRSQLQSRYNAAIENIKRIRDSWASHVGTHGEVVQRNNLFNVKQNIQRIKSSAQRHGITLQLNALENWNP